VLFSLQNGSPLIESKYIAEAQCDANDNLPEAMLLKAATLGKVALQLERLDSTF
jgi:hypothetical protein